MIKLTDVGGTTYWLNPAQVVEFRGSGLRGIENTEVRMVGNSFFYVFQVSPHELAAML